MHWYTCKSLMNTLGRAVEQWAECFAKQVSSRGQSTTVGRARSVKMSYEYLMNDVTVSNWCTCILYMSSNIGHAHSSTHRMQLSPSTLRDPKRNSTSVHVLYRQMPILGSYAKPMEGQELLSFFSEEDGKVTGCFFYVFSDVIFYFHVLQLLFLWWSGTVVTVVRHYKVCGPRMYQSENEFLPRHFSTFVHNCYKQARYKIARHTLWQSGTQPTVINMLQTNIYRPVAAKHLLCYLKKGWPLTKLIQCPVSARRV